MKHFITYLALTLIFVSVGEAMHDKNRNSARTTENKGVQTSLKSSVGPPHAVHLRQGFNMRIQVSNFGTLGKSVFTTAPPESLGCEYPAGSDIEHLYGGGVWIGGIIDTSQTGIEMPATVVTTGYEGWAGPLFEMYPSDDPRDGIWIASVGDSVKPPGWDEYWGKSLPFKPVSDQDFYCQYSDTFKTDIANHVPMHLKVIQKSYAWAGGYADAIIPIEYHIINMGKKAIKEVYIGYFMDMDVGPYYISRDNGYGHNYWEQDYTGYYTDLRTAYIHNPVDRGTTPLGCVLVSTPKPLDSLKYTFRWYPGAQSPPTDGERYQWLGSGVIMPNQSTSDLSDTRFLFGFGPFNIKPKDTLKIVIAVVAGNDLNELRENATRALNLYQRGYHVPVTPPSPPLHVKIGFKRVELDWKWRAGDRGIDPETVRDDSNRIAMRDTVRKGKIFEGYRLYRSEDPSGSVASFTLLKQYDVPDQFEYNTGLQYTFTDSNLVRGKTYWYAVTSFSIPDYSIVTVRNPDGGVKTDTALTKPLESSVLMNAVKIELPFSTSDRLGEVMVVPNPYRTDADYTFENGGWEGRSITWNETKRVIKFIHLPKECTIRIFTMAGELVTTIEHRPGNPGYDPTRGEENWNLLSESNRTVASGVYVFTVESDLGKQIGKFVIIK